jgi:hypothetical protein
MIERDASHPPARFLRRRRIVFGAGILLTGCAEPYLVPGTEPPGPRRLATLEVEGRVEVLQGGRVLLGRDGMPLFAGDEIRTLSSSYAQCRFVDGDRVWLDYDTRVRLGSIFTFFGRVFASVSGVFQVDSEFVSASSEGTEYTVTIGRGSSDFSVAVRSGAVSCRPRQGRWRPVRLTAGERLVGRGVGAPTTDRLDSREYEAEFGWVPASPTPQFKFRQPAPRREVDPPPRSSTPPSTPPSPPSAPSSPPPSSPPRTPPGSTAPGSTAPGSSAPAQISPRPRSGIRERIQRPASPSPNDPR